MLLVLHRLYEKNAASSSVYFSSATNLFHFITSILPHYLGCDDGNFLVSFQIVFTGRTIVEVGHCFFVLLRLEMYI